ncbi:acyl-CoA reductase [Shivajiella indica]|uniref:Acyl-CoA reductase n=1 Tax=Shivajiella indica TaxID=872115 RepID=A0ABW5B993_9BACT
MTLEERIQAFSLLGKVIKELTEEEFESLALKIENNNNWFTQDQTRAAFLAIADFLEKDKLKEWLAPYHLENPIKPKTIGIMMAGNIPAVGFHDLLSVLISGNRAAIKLSSGDAVSIRWLVEKLIAIEPRFEGSVTFEEMLKGKDAYIATGSDNSARYFDYYFGKYDHIIRKNRTSIAVLRGDESQEELRELGKDIFQYFGLGCRNVSKIYIKEEKSLLDLLESISGFHFLTSHHKYLNNYDYNKSIYLVNKDAHLDNGFLLLKESQELVSPIAVLYYEYYKDLPDLESKIGGIQDKIQCVVSKDAWFPKSLKFGEAQCPKLDDYADGVDTIAFLHQLK